jgi:mannan endo-1,4-beta-mannosidase
MTRTARPPRRRLPYFLAIGALAALLIPFGVQAAVSAPYSLMVSGSPERSSFTALSGATVSGRVYVFMTPAGGVQRASFWLDNPAASGSPMHVEGSAPIDFAGTATDGKAKPWDTSSVPAGPHSITVVVQTSSGNATVTTGFSVGGGDDASASPTTAPVATPTPKQTASPTPAPTAAPTATLVQTPPPAGYIGRLGTELTLGGKPFTFTGFNIYQANSRSNCSYTMGTGGALDTALTDIGSGAEVFRAWFFQRLATTNGQRDWSAFDHTLAVAKAHGVKVIVALGNQWGSCESPTSQVKWASWYTGGYKTQVLPSTTVPYRQWVQEIVSRYRNDPTIAMWQLMNEAEVKVDNTSTCAPAADLYNFAADVSGLIKSIDPNHLVSLGTMGSGQCGTQGADYSKVHSISTIDVCEYHDYGHESEALPVKLAGDIAACNALDKPIFVGESGIKATTVGGTLSARAAAFDAKLVAMSAAGVRGFLVWSWNNAAPTTNNWPVGPGDPTINVIDTH